MDTPTLLVIDVQTALAANGSDARNNHSAEDIIASLLKHWRQQHLPVVHVKHNSTEENSQLRPGLPGNAIQACAAPLENEPLFEKTVNSAFIGTELDEYLKQHECQSLVVVGLTTDHCVSTSVRMAANLGYNVQLVSDATATFERFDTKGQYLSAEIMHSVNLASLNGEFCSVVSASELLHALA